MPGVFDYQPNYDPLPIGSVVQAALDLERISNGKWIRLDGRDMSRGEFPLIQQSFPAGIFTTTQRTGNANPNNMLVVCDNTNFLVPGAAGTSAFQASSDGITWSTSATWGASTGVGSLIVAGSRYIATGSAGDFSAPYVSTTGQTAANQVAKSNWTATTSGLTSTRQFALAYSPSLGRTVLIKDASDTTANSIKYLNDGATAWGACSGGSTAARGAVVWTGQRFIVSPGSAAMPWQQSTDGITWSDYYPPEAGATIYLASNGAGTVVYVGSTNYFLVSVDHGASFKRVYVTGNNAGLPNSQGFWYINGRFTVGTYFSTDGFSWSNEPWINGRGVNQGLNCQAFAHNATTGVYCLVGSTTVNFATATEDRGRFRFCDQSNAAVPASTIPSFMKVRL